MGLNTDNLDRTVFISDNLPFLKALDTASVDLMVIDPPFGKTQMFTGTLRPPLSDEEKGIERELMESWGVVDADSAYDAGLEYPDQTGTTAMFEDIWNFSVRVYEDWLESLKDICPGAWWVIQAARHTHGDGTAAYIAFMVERVLEIRRVLKPSGTLYLHCDHEANAYLRQMLDAVFGKNNYIVEIVWNYGTPSGGRTSGKRPVKSHDTILCYSKQYSKHIYNRQYTPYSESYTTNWFRHTDEDGRKYRTRSRRGRIIRQYLDESPGVPLSDTWTDIRQLYGSSGWFPNTRQEITGYPTQKPQELARRIIQASSNEGDLVLDCFAGCSYVPVAAELTGRRWIACDMSPRAWTVVRRQFHKQTDLRIVTEGEFADNDGGVQPDLRPEERKIRVRGPYELPARTTADEQKPLGISALPNVRYRQRPLEDSQTIWEAFVDYWGTNCWYCGLQKLRSRRELQLDHIAPNKRDGSNDDCWNRALACIDCNGDKGHTLSVEQTIDRALAAGRITTDALRNEQLARFKARQQWAVKRWHRIKPRPNPLTTKS